MKRFIEEDDSAWDSLAGEVVTIFSLNYIYTGKLIAVNDTCVELENPSIVYETGAFSVPKWKDAQPLPHNIFVSMGCIEAFGKVK